MNHLICSIGKHAKLIKNIKSTIGKDSRIIVTANQEILPSLYFADAKYILPDVHDENYIEELLKVCKTENIDSITTMLDVETIILAKNKDAFEKLGIEVLSPNIESAMLCFDKYSMYKHLVKNNIKTIETYNNLDSFISNYNSGKINFPVFIKPNSGRGSIGARKINTYEELKEACKEDNIIIQKYIDGIEIYVDVYIDTISKNPVSIFCKKKIGSQIEIGGTTKSISLKDKKLTSYVKEVVSKFNFNGPINIDLFYLDGEYILNEINPRLSSSYLHAYGCGVNFFELLENNLKGIENDVLFGDYKEDVIMMMYTDVLLIDKKDLAISKGVGY